MKNEAKKRNREGIRGGKRNKMRERGEKVEKGKNLNVLKIINF